MKTLLKCTLRCLISLSIMNICLTMRSPQRCLPLRMDTTILNHKTTSRVTNQDSRTVIKTRIRNSSSITSMVPLLAPSKSNSSNMTITWVI